MQRGTRSKGKKEKKRNKGQEESRWTQTYEYSKKRGDKLNEMARQLSLEAAWLKKKVNSVPLGPCESCGYLHQQYTYSFHTIEPKAFIVFH